MESFTSRSTNKNSTDQLITINGNELLDSDPIPVVIKAGADSIGKLSIDQTIPGTTNGVYVNTVAAGGSADIGAVADAAVTDPTAAASMIAALKGLISQLQGMGTGSAPVDLVTALSSTYDTIDVNKMSKGTVVVAHDAIVITTTSVEIDCRGFNTISVECAVSAITSGNWQIECLGCAVTGGTFGRCYNMNGLEMKVTGLDTNETRALTFYGVPNYTKIRATRTTDGTLTCKVTPLNL